MNTITVDMVKAMTFDERNALYKRLSHAQYYALAMQSVANGHKYNANEMTHIDDAHRRFKDWSFNGAVLPESWEDLRDLMLVLIG